MSELTVNQVDVAKLNVAPGEILMVTVKGMITMDVSRRVKDAFERAFKEHGGNVPTILVIDDNIEARVIRADEAAALSKGFLGDFGEDIGRNG